MSWGGFNNSQGQILGQVRRTGDPKTQSWCSYRPLTTTAHKEDQRVPAGHDFLATFRSEKGPFRPSKRFRKQELSKVGLFTLEGIAPHGIQGAAYIGPSKTSHWPYAVQVRSMPARSLLSNVSVAHRKHILKKRCPLAHSMILP